MQENLTNSLKNEARRIGFDFAGICPAVQPTGFNQLRSWLDAGYAGEMSYIGDRVEAYRDPNSILDGVVSVMMLALNYQTPLPAASDLGTGRVSRYAWSGIDYHDLIHGKLQHLVNFCQSKLSPINARGVVDTAPLLEREFARLAGLGWQAKNTMLINRQIGSWFFLAALLVDQPLEYDQPFESSHCGNCTACLDACPTNAFVEPHVLDATRCISYLTIEHREPIPIELRPQMDDWVFGCDVCQEVCPWNNKAIASDRDEFHPDRDLNPLDLRSLFFLTDSQFRIRFRKTPLWRPKRRGILRNAAIALGNQPDDENVSALTTGLCDDEALIRGACAWALGRHNFSLAQPVLQQRRGIESDQYVLQEIALALRD